VQATSCRKKNFEPDCWYELRVRCLKTLPSGNTLIGAFSSTVLTKTTVGTKDFGQARKQEKANEKFRQEFDEALRGAGKHRKGKQHKAPSSTAGSQRLVMVREEIARVSRLDTKFVQSSVLADYTKRHCKSDLLKLLQAEMMRLLRQELKDVGISGLSAREHHGKDKGDFTVGQKIKARYAGGKKWYPGTIIRKKKDGTCDIEYDDGDKERGVSSECIRARTESSRGGGGEGQSKETAEADAARKAAEEIAAAANQKMEQERAARQRAETELLAAKQKIREQAAAAKRANKTSMASNADRKSADDSSANEAALKV
jgi:hypothetical protein